MPKKSCSGNPKIDEINSLVEEIEKLKQKLNEKRIAAADLPSITKTSEDLSLTPLIPCRMSCAHILKAHNSRIHDVIWSADDSRLISVGAENCVVFWAVKSGLIDNLVDAALQQPLTADISPDLMTMFCGGLCANVVLYNANKKGEHKEDFTEYLPAATLEHDSRVTCIKHIPQTNELITCGETDGTIIWDLNTMKIKNSFHSHISSVTTLQILNKSHAFLTGGSDGVIKLWDTRSKDPGIITFIGHESDISSMDAFHNRTSFISGSDDTFCHLYDIRYDYPISRYSDPVWNETDLNKDNLEQTCLRPDVASVSSVAITNSGRMFLTGCNDSMMYYWDVFAPESSVYQREEAGPIRKLAFSHAGNGLASVLWDNKNRLRIFIPS